VETFLESGDKKTEIAKKVHGQVAISSAKAAYQIYREILAVIDLRSWLMRCSCAAVALASTSTKNPNYSDVKYIEPLIGLDTVTRLP